MALKSIGTVQAQRLFAEVIKAPEYPMAERFTAIHLVSDFKFSASFWYSELLGLLPTINPRSMESSLIVTQLSKLVLRRGSASDIAFLVATFNEMFQDQDDMKVQFQVPFVGISPNALGHRSRLLWPSKDSSRWILRAKLNDSSNSYALNNVASFAST